MSIQYPKTEHVTLPSVEDWGSNTNILRDPPKSITTRRIDKVGQNTDITQLLDDSGDRINEGISVYSRGINPMVSVSYSNDSNNSGMSGNITSTSSRVQARPPYPVFEGGAFRPPMYTQRDLIPLSRLPRTWFGTLSTPGFVDFSKTIQKPNDYRALKDALNVYCVQPNKTAIIDKPLVENFKMLNTINDKHITLDVNAGHKSNFISSYTREHADMQKGINENNMNVFAQSKSTKDISQNLEGISINENKYIQDLLHSQAFTNKTSNHSQNLNNIDMDTTRYLQNVHNIEANVNMSRQNTQSLANIDMNTSRYLQDGLLTEATSNMSRQNTQGLANIDMNTSRYLQDGLLIEATSNMSRQNTQGLANLDMDTSRYLQEIYNIEANANKSRQNTQGLTNIDMNTSRYLQDVYNIEANANPSFDVMSKDLNQLNDRNRRTSVKDNMIQYSKQAGIKPSHTFLNDIATPILEMRNPQFEVISQKSDSTIYKRIDHDNDLKYNRNTPLTNYTTNVTKIDDFNNIYLSSRDYKLEDSLIKGGFENSGYQPNINDRADLIHYRKSDKDKIRSLVNDQQFNRYSY
jgi:hypothetical protein